MIQVAAELNLGKNIFNFEIYQRKEKLSEKWIKCSKWYTVNSKIRNLCVVTYRFISYDNQSIKPNHFLVDVACFWVPRKLEFYKITL